MISAERTKVPAHPASRGAPGLRRGALAATAGALVLASCAGAPPAAGSGIEGRVTIGPTCPVVRADSPCPDRPYAAEIRVVAASGEEVARVRSGEDGRFRVDLRPGTYTLVPEGSSAKGPPHAEPETVTVSQGRYTQVSIAYDSGIR
jgi:hypothetical protein